MAAARGERDEQLERERRDAIVELLERRFGHLPDELRQRVKVSTSADVMAWSDKAITAESLADVFG